jgi:asparagine synthase (glutamine-hydrolysing)
MIFGFLGPFSASTSRADLDVYGRGVAEASYREFGSDSNPSGGGGPSVAADGDCLVVVQGQPTLAGSGGTWDMASRVLDAYRSHGADFLKTARGRFAIAIVDVRSQRAVLAVDPMGIEKLCYAVRGDGVVFASSAEAVARHPVVGTRLAPQALFDYLMLHMVPGPDTVFQSVRKIAPGTYAVIERGVTRSARLWTPRFTETGGEPFDTLAGDLHDALRGAVRRCGIDEPSGAFLSGGLDSSSVAGVLSEVAPAPANTFSIGFGYPDYDELPYARVANRHFGCAPHEYTVTGSDIAAGFAPIARAFDEPFGNSSALPSYFCARLAREHGVRHLLAGDGGDEIFGGNSRYVEQRVFEHYHRLPAWARRVAIEPVVAGWPRLLDGVLIRKARGYIAQANTPMPARLETWNFLRRIGPGQVLDPQFLAAIDADAPLRRMQQIWDEAPCESLLNRMLYYDWHYTLADNDLRKVETAAAMAGVRVSYPMLDPAVIDVALRVPPQLMIAGGRLRDFYKRAMRGFLPPEILTKKKHGFGLPFGLWLQESAELRDLILGNLEDLRQRRILRGEFLDRLLHLHGTDDARYYGVFVWVLAMLEQWFKEHGVAP